jgi:hypothetical protein
LVLTFVRCAGPFARDPARTLSYIWKEIIKTIIEEIEQEVLDIDWFFTNGHEIGFVASGGGRLPTSIAKFQDIDTLSTYFRSVPKSTDIITNPILESIVGNGSVDDRYLFDFVEMAKRGLYTFDKSVFE